MSGISSSSSSSPSKPSMKVFFTLTLVTNSRPKSRTALSGGMVSCTMVTMTWERE
jgi:hypothetical protein